MCLYWATYSEILAKQGAIMKRQQGFTLVEVMVAVAVLGILAAIAYPSYTAYVAKGNRAEAQAYMLDLAQAQSQFLADNRAYAAATGDLGVAAPAGLSGKYTFAVAASSGPPPSYTITATPVAGSRQAADGTLTLNSSGARSPAHKW